MKHIARSEFDALLRWEDDGGPAVDFDEYVVVRDSVAEMHVDSGRSVEGSIQIESRARQLPIDSKKHEDL